MRKMELYATNETLFHAKRTDASAYCAVRIYNVIAMALVEWHSSAKISILL